MTDNIPNSIVGLNSDRVRTKNPADNIELGVKYLGTLLKQFDQNIIYALSAYNAGPTATKRWLSFRQDLDNIDFIETIPYDETSLYIKLVLRNYMLYQLIYDHKHPKLASLLKANSHEFY